MGGGGITGERNKAAYVQNPSFAVPNAKEKQRDKVKKMHGPTDQ